MSKRQRERDKEMLLKQIAEKRAKLEAQGDIRPKGKTVTLPGGVDPLDSKKYRLPPALLKSVIKRKKRSKSLFGIYLLL